MYEWFAFAMIWVALWLLFYIEKPILRKQMFIASLFGAATGLAEPFFVPRYWSPPSLFNLNVTTHFDLESIIFFFASGGIAAIIYEAALGVKNQSRTRFELGENRRVTMIAFAATPAIFLPLYFLTNLNPIYSISIAMFIGAVAGFAWKPSLIKNAAIGGILFAGLNFFFFAFVSSASPTFLDSWNISTLSGIRVLGIPVETMLFGFTFGMAWSGIYLLIKRHVLFSKNDSVETVKPVSA